MYYFLSCYNNTSVSLRCFPWDACWEHVIGEEQDKSSFVFINNNTSLKHLSQHSHFQAPKALFGHITGDILMCRKPLVALGLTTSAFIFQLFLDHGGQSFVISWRYRFESQVLLKVWLFGTLLAPLLFLGKHNLLQCVETGKVSPYAELSALRMMLLFPDYFPLKRIQNGYEVRDEYSK